MSQELEAEFGELADKLVDFTVQLIADRLEAAVRAATDFDKEAVRAKIMKKFEEARQRNPRL